MADPRRCRHRIVTVAEAGTEVITSCIDRVTGDLIRSAEADIAATPPVTVTCDSCGTSYRFLAGSVSRIARLPRWVRSAWDSHVAWEYREPIRTPEPSTDPSTEVDDG